MFLLTFCWWTESIWKLTQDASTFDFVDAAESRWISVASEVNLWLLISKFWKTAFIEVTGHCAKCCIVLHFSHDRCVYLHFIIIWDLFYPASCTEGRELVSCGTVNASIINWLTEVLLPTESAIFIVLLAAEWFHRLNFFYVLCDSSKTVSLNYLLCHVLQVFV